MSRVFRSLCRRRGPWCLWSFCRPPPPPPSLAYPIERCGTQFHTILGTVLTERHVHCHMAPPSLVSAVSRRQPDQPDLGVSVPKSLPANPLLGSLMYLRRCRGCRERSGRMERFVDLSLTLPEARYVSFSTPSGHESLP